MDLQRVENELKKRLVYPYKWGRKQSNSWDSDTNFIYKTYSLESLLLKMVAFNQDLRDYALNWSAMAVEDIFGSHQVVQPNKYIYDKLVDFNINMIPFDHKTSIFPKGFNKTIEYAQTNKKELITWLYENQSQQGRKHLKNRLFIVLYDNNAHQHWKMKAEIMFLKISIDNYLKTFSKQNLVELDFGNGAVFSDIIWIKNNGKNKLI